MLGPEVRFLQEEIGLGLEANTGMGLSRDTPGWLLKVLHASELQLSFTLKEQREKDEGNNE